jgi:hypothetical protein
MWSLGGNKLNISPERQKNLSFEILEILKNQGISPNMFDSNGKADFIYRVKNIASECISEINSIRTGTYTDQMKTIIF